MEDNQEQHHSTLAAEQYKNSERIFVFSDEFLCVEIPENGNWLYANWMGYQSEEQIKKGCEIILDAVIKHGVKQMLNDNSNVVGIWTPAAKWVGSVWVPSLQKAGLTHLAWVHSPNRLSQVSTNAAIEFLPDAHVIKTFYSLDEAKAWLLPA